MIGLAGKEGKTILTNASKQLLISSPPAILILHLKRFQVVSFTFKKKRRKVKFPMVFDLTPYCSVKCKVLDYTYYVIEGRFIPYKKSFFDGRFFCLAYIVKVPH